MFERDASLALSDAQFLVEGELVIEATAIPPSILSPLRGWNKTG